MASVEEMEEVGLEEQTEEVGLVEEMAVVEEMAEVGMEEETAVVGLADKMEEALVEGKEVVGSVVVLDVPITLAAGSMRASRLLSERKHEGRD